MNFKQIKAIEQANKRQILAVNPEVPERSGIYFLLRRDGDFKYAYIGQAKRLLTRLAGHLKGYQHIDLSIKKHGLYSENNPTGYKIYFLEYPQNKLDEMEQKYIKQYANAGYQLRNVESGGNLGKTDIGERKPAKKYFDGVEQGKKNTREFVKHLFGLHLDYVPKKNPPTKLQEKAMQKFKDFLEDTK